MREELERLEPGSFAAFLRFLALGRVQYRTSLDQFVSRNFDHLGQFLTPASLLQGHVWKLLTTAFFTADGLSLFIDLLVL